MDENHRETAERLHAIMESAVDGILAIDEHGTIASTNAAATRIFGYERDELLGANVAMLMPAPHRDRHDAYVKRFLETGEARIIGSGREVMGRRKDGTIFPLYLAVSEGRHRDEPIFTGIVRDLSDLRRAEERARSAEQLASLAVITAGIAHDVGTPMNVILGYADMLRDSLKDPKDKRRA
ncbi:MAG TPA: PAS domain S-box protein, partial [Myxococcota bacterium]|nr:PAS domain S-box protein [Myxococcota bacterium]